MEARTLPGERSTAASLHRMNFVHKMALKPSVMLKASYGSTFRMTTAEREIDGDSNENSKDVSHKLSRLVMLCLLLNQ